MLKREEKKANVCVWSRFIIKISLFCREEFPLSIKRQRNQHENFLEKKENFFLEINEKEISYFYAIIRQIAFDFLFSWIAPFDIIHLLWHINIVSFSYEKLSLSRFFIFFSLQTLQKYLNLFHQFFFLITFTAWD